MGQSLSVKAQKRRDHKASNSSLSYRHKCAGNNNNSERMRTYAYALSMPVNILPATKSTVYSTRGTRGEMTAAVHQQKCSMWNICSGWQISSKIHICLHEDIKRSCHKTAPKILFGIKLYTPRLDINYNSFGAGVVGIQIGVDNIYNSIGFVFSPEVFFITDIQCGII